MGRSEHHFCVASPSFLDTLQQLCSVPCLLVGSYLSPGAHPAGKLPSLPSLSIPLHPSALVPETDPARLLHYPQGLQADFFWAAPHGLKVQSSQIGWWEVLAIDGPPSWTPGDDGRSQCPVKGSRRPQRPAAQSWTGLSGGSQEQGGGRETELKCAPLP